MVKKIVHITSKDIRLGLNTKKINATVTSAKFVATKENNSDTVEIVTTGYRFAPLSEFYGKPYKEWAEETYSFQEDLSFVYWFGQAPEDTISFPEERSVKLSKALTDTTGITNTVATSTQKPLEDQLIFSDYLSYTFRWAQAPTDTATFSEDIIISQGYNKVYADSLIATEILSSSVGNGVLDTSTFSEINSIKNRNEIQQNILISEIAILSFVWAQQLQDTSNISEAIIIAMGRGLSYEDAIATSERSSILFNSSLIEIVYTSEEAAISTNNVLLETAGITESASKLLSSTITDDSFISENALINIGPGVETVIGVALEISSKFYKNEEDVADLQDETAIYLSTDSKVDTANITEDFNKTPTKGVETQTTISEESNFVFSYLPKEDVFYTETFKLDYALNPIDTIGFSEILSRVVNFNLSLEDLFRLQEDFENQRDVIVNWANISEQTIFSVKSSILEPLAVQELNSIVFNSTYSDTIGNTEILKIDIARILTEQTTISEVSTVLSSKPFEEGTILSEGTTIVSSSVKTDNITSSEVSSVLVKALLQDQSVNSEVSTIQISSGLVETASINAADGLICLQDYFLGDYTVQSGPSPYVAKTLQSI
jgi:hypothetical protein